jgi:hypothetical protein
LFGRVWDDGLIFSLDLLDGPPQREGKRAAMTLDFEQSVIAANLRLRDHALNALYRMKIIAEGLEHESIHSRAG